MNNQKIAVVVNPASANGMTARRWPEIAALLEQAGISFNEYLTRGPGDATEHTRRMLKESYDLIISVGGDGTANEVINGFFTPDGPVSKEAAVAFISMGTGSDLIKTLNIPKEPGEAVRHLANSSRRAIDVGRVSFTGHDGSAQTRYFVNIAGLGLDGDTVARVNRTSKALGGFVSFLWGTVISLLLYRNRRMAVTVDGELVCDAPVTVVVIGNGRYFGGGMCIAPHATMDDARFDIVLLNNMSKPALLANLPKVYKGTHLSHPKVTCRHGQSVSITSPEIALLDLDGEQPGRAPVEIELLPGSLLIQG
ncbi:MAG: diacylglycerol kinase family protein [Bacillota bacterium]